MRCIFAGDTNINITELYLPDVTFPPFDPIHCEHAILLILAYVFLSLVLNFLIVYLGIVQVHVMRRSLLNSCICNSSLLYICFISLSVVKRGIRALHISSCFALPFTSFLLLFFPTSSVWIEQTHPVTSFDISIVCVATIGLCLYYIKKVSFGSEKFEVTVINNNLCLQEPNVYSITSPAFPEGDEEDGDIIKEETGN
jgi:hypothetical protein